MSFLSKDQYNFLELRENESGEVKLITYTFSQKDDGTANIVKSCDNNKIKLIFDKPQLAITPGQSAVFYEDDTVIGGGIIELDNE